MVSTWSSGSFSQQQHGCCDHPAGPWMALRGGERKIPTGSNQVLLIIRRIFTAQLQMTVLQLEQMLNQHFLFRFF